MYLTIMLCFMLFSSVYALQYTGYKKGDIVNINVGSNITQTFYILEDSNSSNSKVKALLKGTIGEPFKYTNSGKTFSTSSVSTKLNEYTSGWTYVDSKDLLDYNMIFPNSQTEDRSMVTITDSIFYSDNNYYTKDFELDDTNSSVTAYYRVEKWSASTYYYTSVSCEGQENAESYLRPYIVVDKTHVVGGTSQTEDEKTWKQFVEKFKTTDFITSLTESDDEDSITISNTDSTLKIVTIEDNKTYTTNFNYANGIITYVPSTEDINKMIDTIYVYNCIETIVDLKGYNEDKFNDWLSEDLTLSNDGIEYATEILELEGTSTGGSYHITDEIFTKFKLDIKNGAKSYKEETTKNDTTTTNKNVDKNPQTGLKQSIILILGLLLISSISYIIYKKVKKPIKSNKKEDNK